MIIIDGFPPNIEEIRKELTPPPNTVFTFGEVIYAPGIDFKLPDDLIVHEETHQKQQGNRAQDWWRRYLKDINFRFEQELAAYRNQYRFFAKHHNRNQTFNFAREIAMDLSSQMYGNIVDFTKALNMIQS